MARETGRQAVVEALRQEGVRRVYGLPGDPVHLYDALADVPEVLACGTSTAARGCLRSPCPRSSPAAATTRRPEAVAWYRDLLPSSELVVFEESAHLAHLEERELYNQTVAGFLATVESQA